MILSNNYRYLFLTFLMMFLLIGGCSNQQTTDDVNVERKRIQKTELVNEYKIVPQHLIKPFQIDTGAVRATKAFEINDKKLMAIGGNTNKIQIWKLSNSNKMSILREFQFDSRPSGFDVSKQTGILVANNEYYIETWDISTGKLISRSEEPIEEPILAVKFIQNYSKVMVLTRSDRVYLLNGKDLKEPVIHYDLLNQAAHDAFDFSDQRPLMAYLNWRGQVTLVDTDKLKIVDKLNIDLEEGLNQVSLRFNYRSNKLSIFTDGSVQGSSGATHLISISEQNKFHSSRFVEKDDWGWTSIEADPTTDGYFVSKSGSETGGFRISNIGETKSKLTECIGPIAIFTDKTVIIPSYLMGKYCVFSENQQVLEANFSHYQSQEIEVIAPNLDVFTFRKGVIFKLSTEDGRITEVPFASLGIPVIAGVSNNGNSLAIIFEDNEGNVLCALLNTQNLEIISTVKLGQDLSNTQYEELRVTNSEQIFVIRNETKLLHINEDGDAVEIEVSHETPIHDFLYDENKNVISLVMNNFKYDQYNNGYFFSSLNLNLPQEQRKIVPVSEVFHTSDRGGPIVDNSIKLFPTDEGVVALSFDGYAFLKFYYSSADALKVHQKTLNNFGNAPRPDLLSIDQNLGKLVASGWLHKNYNIRNFTSFYLDINFLRRRENIQYVLSSDQDMLSFGNYRAGYSPDNIWVAGGDAPFNCRYASKIRYFTLDDPAIYKVRCIQPNGENSLWSSNGAQWDLIARTFIDRDRNWITITPENFFDGSIEGAKMLNLTHDLEIATMDQFFDVLYNPELVRKKHQGDLAAVNLASSKVALKDIIEKGAPPRFKIISPTNLSISPTDKVDLFIELFDRGGGLGNVVITVNSKVITKMAEGTKFEFLNLPLDKKVNKISIRAENKTGTFSSKDQTLTISVDEKFDRELPRLHILSIAVKDYKYYQDLNFPINDQNKIIELFKNIDIKEHGFRATPNIHQLADPEVTFEKIDSKFEELKSENGPNKILTHDIFLLHVSGHGISFDNDYFFIPHDFLVSDEGLRKAAFFHGIGQKKWTGWLNGINANKNLLIFDTCQSGTLASIVGKDRSRLDGFVENMKRNNGSILIAASGSQEIALEGKNNLGVLTYAFIRSLGAADDSDNAIDTKDIADEVLTQVPIISAELIKNHPRYSKNDPQVPKIVRNDDDFGLLRKRISPKIMERLLDESNFPPAGYFVTNEKVTIYESINPAIPSEKYSLEKYTVVSVNSRKNDWAEIKSDGEIWGFVEWSKLHQLK